MLRKLSEGLLLLLLFIISGVFYLYRRATHPRVKQIESCNRCGRMRHQWKNCKRCGVQFHKETASVRTEK